MLSNIDMSIQSIVSLSCFKGINEALDGKPALAMEDFLDLLRQDVRDLESTWHAYKTENCPVDRENEYCESFLRKHAEAHKYVVLRDKATGALTFFFVFNYPDTDFGSLAMYAGVVCTNNQYRAVDGIGQLDQALAAIMTADSAKKQFDWIGYGHFWLNTFEGKIQLGLDYNYPVLHDESEAYWHEGLSEVARDQLANFFGVYVSMNFTLKRQSSPGRLWTQSSIK